MEEKAITMPLLGDDFPELEVSTTHGPMSIPRDFKGSWFLLFSHPADFTPVCATEILDLAEMQEMPLLAAVHNAEKFRV